MYLMYHSKNILATVLFLLFGLSTWACSCITFADDFCTTLEIDTTVNLLVKCVKIEDIHYGIKVKILNVLQGEETNDTIMVWGDNGALCRTYTDGFGVNDTLLLALHHTDFYGNLIPNFSYPLDLEQAGDYMISSTCGKYYMTQEELSEPIGDCEIMNALITDIDAPSENIDLQLFPNPVSDYLYLTSNKIPKKVIIMNTAGQVLQQQIPTNLDTYFDLTGLNGGLYFVKFIFSNQEIIKKIVVK